jgi:hypothetical protein
MSDAIVLDVADTTPVRLDVGDADPIAREEIAELTERVTTVEGDVSGLSTRVGAAEGDISTLGTTVDGIDARVEAIEADGSVTPVKLADTPFPSLLAGAARSLTGTEPTEATFLDRACPGTTGQATVQSVRGNTVVQDGSLLPVRMEGIETVGFNQIDLTKVHGVAHYNPSVGTVFASGTSETATMTGENPCVVTVSSAWGGLSIISDELIPGETYLLEGNVSDSAPRMSVAVLDASYAVTRLLNNYTGGYNISNRFTPADTERYLVISVSSTKIGTVTLTNLCLHISDPARNGTYEPYWSSERTIPASTYFPDGMRSAGTVRDELTETQAITRVWEVDLGTLEWRYDTSNGRFNTPVLSDVAKTSYRAETPCAKYDYAASGAVDKTVFAFNGAIYIYDSAYTDPAAFKAAMSGVMLHYALATPTTTPIDPPLNLTYRAENGGTERITHTEQSAPPVLSIAYGHTAEGIVREAASAIAAQDGPTATTNHAVGSYLTMGGTLYRVTTAIATGEAITPGTNVMATTVMAEVLSLIQ